MRISDWSSDVCSSDLRTYEALTLAGFRRSHLFAYRPACTHCNACTPVRVVVADFAPGRSLRRILRSNADLTVRFTPPRATAEQIALFRGYIHSRHGDGRSEEHTSEPQ